MSKVGAKATNFAAPLVFTVDGAYGGVRFALDATIDPLAKLGENESVSFLSNADALDVSLKVQGMVTGATTKPLIDGQVAIVAEKLVKL